MSEKTDIQNNMEDLIRQLEQPMLNEEGLPFVEIMEREESEPNAVEKTTLGSMNEISDSVNKNSIKSRLSTSLAPGVLSNAPDSKIAPIPIVREIKENFISTDSAFLEYLRRMEQEANEDEIGVFEYPEWITHSIFGEEVDSDTEEDTASLTTVEDEHSPVNAEYSQNINIANIADSPLDITIIPTSSNIREENNLKSQHINIKNAEFHEVKKVRFSNVDDVREFDIEEEHDEPKTRQELGISKFKARRMGLHDEE